MLDFHLVVCCMFQACQAVGNTTAYLKCCGKVTADTLPLGVYVHWPVNSGVVERLFLMGGLFIVGVGQK